MRTLVAIIAIFFCCGFVLPAAASFTNNLSIHTSYKPKKWKSLGKRKVGFGNDKDEIKVEVKEGAIILKSIEVHFAEGTSKCFRIRETMKGGDSTGDLELPGNDRVISRIVLSYETSELFKDRARIEVY